MTYHDLYRKYEGWLEKRRGDHYGADHLVGEIKDEINELLKYVKSDKVKKQILRKTEFELDETLFSFGDYTTKEFDLWFKFKGF